MLKSRYAVILAALITTAGCSHGDGGRLLPLAPRVTSVGTSEVTPPRQAQQSDSSYTRPQDNNIAPLGWYRDRDGDMEPVRRAATDRSQPYPVADPRVAELQAKIAACDVQMEAARQDYRRTEPSEASYRYLVNRSDNMNAKIFGIESLKWRYQSELHQIQPSYSLPAQPVAPPPIDSLPVPHAVQVDAGEDQSQPTGSAAE